MQEELKDYEAKKNELKGAIKANNFKLDDEYKQELTKRANDIVSSVKEGAKHTSMSGGKRDKKKKEKSKLNLIGNDIDNLNTNINNAKANGAKRDKLADLSSLFEQLDAKRLKKDHGP